MVHKCASVWAGLRSDGFSNVGIHSAQAVATALSYMRRLETLRLSKGTVTEGLVLGLANSCPTLRVLKITDCFADNSTDAWQSFAAGHPSMREFSFSSSVTDDMMVALSTHCPQITRLELQSAQLLTDISVVALSKGCPQFSEVTLRQVTALTDGSLQALRAHCKQLQRLQLPGRDALAHIYIVV
jgi:F-box/leucine-rich repeat protein 2/20